MFNNCNFLVLLFVFFISFDIAHAEPELIKICAKYQRSDYTYSHNYKLKAFWLDGNDLNEITDSYDYDSWEYFLIIPWDEGGYSLFKTESFNKPNIFEETYEDQRGRSWLIKKGWDFCY